MGEPDARPRLAVLVGEGGSLSPHELAEAARGIADLCLLVDVRDARRSPALVAVATALGPVEVVDLADVHRCVEMLRDRGVGAVATFVDSYCDVVDTLNA